MLWHWPHKFDFNFHNAEKKIVRVAYYKRNFDSFRKFLSSGKILTVHELFVNDLSKFVLRSLNNINATKCFFFSSYKSPEFLTRSAAWVNFKNRLCNCKFLRN